jgi:uncharacterized membrane protein YdjX (TVP38/TMEM64 family)
MKRWRPAAVAKLVLALAVLAVGLGLAARHADLGAQANRGVAFFREAGPLAFFLAMAFLPVLGFPLAPFTLVAGPVFGPVIGLGNVILCTLLAVTVNVAISYWIASRALRPLVSRGVRWLGYTLPEVQPAAAWTVILLVRIVPGPPFFLQSYLLGLARVPFGVYMLVSTVVPAAYLTGTILFGDALARGDRWAMAGAGALFLVAGGVLHQLRRRLKPTVKAGPDGG